MAATRAQAIASLPASARLNRMLLQPIFASKSSGVFLKGQAPPFAQRSEYFSDFNMAIKCSAIAAGRASPRILSRSSKRCQFLRIALVSESLWQMGQVQMPNWPASALSDNIARRINLVLHPLNWVASHSVFFQQCPQPVTCAFTDDLKAWGVPGADKKFPHGFSPAHAKGGRQKDGRHSRSMLSRWS